MSFVLSYSILSRVSTRWNSGQANICMCSIELIYTYVGVFWIWPWKLTLVMHVQHKANIYAGVFLNWTWKLTLVMHVQHKAGVFGTLSWNLILVLQVELEHIAICLLHLYSIFMWEFLNLFIIFIVVLKPISIRSPQCRLLLLWT